MVGASGSSSMAGMLGNGRGILGSLLALLKKRGRVGYTMAESRFGDQMVPIGSQDQIRREESKQMTR